MAALLLVVPAWLAGIFLYVVLQLPTAGLAIGFAAGLLLLLYAYFYNRRYSYLPGLAVSAALPLCLLAFCLGGLRMNWAEPSREPGSLLSFADAQEVRLVGVVSSEPVYTERSGSYRLNLRQIFAPANSANPQIISGEVFVRGAARPHRQSGDLLEIVGKLEEPREISGDNFPYRDWLARQGLFVTVNYPSSTRKIATEQDFFLTMAQWFTSLRVGATANLQQFVPGEEGGLLVGMLLGDRSGIGPELNKAFRDTGTSHIVAISGSNITIVIGLVVFVLGRFVSKKPTLIITLLIIAAYVILVGASASVVRAGLMGALSLGGLLLGREYAALLGLEASALIMSLFQPRVIWDVGFELSFLATLGLIIIARPLEDWKFVAKWPPLLKEGLLITIAAEIMVLPLAAFYFHQISFVSLLANVFAVPALEAIMAVGLIAAGFGWIFGGWLPILAVGAGAIVWIFLVYLIGTVEFFASLPFASTMLPTFSPIWLFYYYALLGLLIWLARDSQKRWQLLLNRAATSPLAYGGLVGIAALIWLLILFF